MGGGRWIETRQLGGTTSGKEKKEDDDDDDDEEEEVEIGKRERDLPDDEELIKEMPPLMIDYSALMGRVFLFSKWRRKRKDSRQKRGKEKRNKDDEGK